MAVRIVPERRATVQEREERGDIERRFPIMRALRATEQEGGVSPCTIRSIPDWLDRRGITNRLFNRNELRLPQDREFGLSGSVTNLHHYANLRPVTP